MIVTSPESGVHLKMLNLLIFYGSSNGGEKQPLFPKHPKAMYYSKSIPAIYIHDDSLVLG